MIFPKTTDCVFCSTHPQNKETKKEMYHSVMFVHLTQNCLSAMKITSCFLFLQRKLCLIRRRNRVGCSLRWHNGFLKHQILALLLSLHWKEEENLVGNVRFQYGFGWSFIEQNNWAIVVGLIFNCWEIFSNRGPILNLMFLRYMRRAKIFNPTPPVVNNSKRTPTFSIGWCRFKVESNPCTAQEHLQFIPRQSFRKAIHT